MDKMFDIVEIAIMTVIVLLGIASFIGGIVSGMWHCFLIGGMCTALAYVWHSERKEDKSWQEKNTKN